MFHVVSELMSGSFVGTALAAEADGEIAGFSVMKYEAWNRRAHLAHLYIAPAFQGRGLGRLFVEKAAAFGRENAARCLWLETQNVNYPAIQFYRKMGFRLCGFDETLYEPGDARGEAALYFVMDL
jgi:ribosomal protein S18 acetylase RimI-like enzyme